ncbi:hypothetical protein BDZ97DRAFT_1924148 [Flammula alnicola]|nr:hypothetical protein BDZ97DRAFT_1924148 [Flammula alnicola]
MPIELPPPLQVPLRTINANLQQPSDPPTAIDVVQAARYAKAVLGTHELGGAITDEEASAALEYQVAVISAKSTAAAPLWFQTALNQINTRFDEQKAQIAGVLFTPPLIPRGMGGNPRGMEGIHVEWFWIPRGMEGIHVEWLWNPRGMKGIHMESTWNDEIPVESEGIPVDSRDKLR